MTTDRLNVELAPGYSIAPIINGCWQLTPDHGGGPDSRKHCLYRFAELVDHGFTSFDCADIYEGTEELLGEFRRSLLDPEKIQVHTKLVPNKNALAELDDRLIDFAIDSSRSKLGVDTLDLVQFHWWDYEVEGLERLYNRLLHAKSVGKIRLLGVTNFNTAQLRNLLSIDESIVTMQAAIGQDKARSEIRPTAHRTPAASHREHCNNRPFHLLAVDPATNTAPASLRWTHRSTADSEVVRY